MSEPTIKTAPDNPDWVTALCADEPPPVPVLGKDVGPPTTPVDTNTPAKRVGLWWLAGVVVAAVLMTAAVVMFGAGPESTPLPTHRAIVAAPAVSAAPIGGLPAPEQAAVPFTAATASCGPGSTSPQALTDTSSDSAWVCARGTQESLVDGQVLHVSFTCGHPEPTCSYMVSSLSVTPGWLAKTVGGTDQWSAHRVVARLQFNFFNGIALAADPFFVDTNSVHGPVTAALPGPVLASRVDMLVLHTERPPAAPDQPSPTETSDDPSTLADPADATFAMSQLQFFGHAPH